MELKTVRIELNEYQKLSEIRDKHSLGSIARALRFYMNDGSITPEPKAR